MQARGRGAFDRASSRVDALALWDLSGTRTPAELLGVLPIAFVDGEAGSALGWTLFLAGRAVGWRGWPGRDLLSFVIDLQRFRPVATVVLAALLMLPSLGELAAGNLSAVTFLVRLALALAVCAVLVWALTGMVLRYARMHAQRSVEGDPFGRRDRMDG